MATARPDRPAGRIAGESRVTLTRTGGAAGPDWGAYVLLYTTRRTDQGLVEAVIAAAPPDQVDPVLGLHRPRPYGPTGTARRPLADYASAANAPRGTSESAAAYAQRMALYLLRTATATAARQIGPPHVVDLPWAHWEIHTEEHVVLAPLKGPGSHGWGGHDAVRVGRLLTVASAAR